MQRVRGTLCGARGAENAEKCTRKILSAWFSLPGLLKNYKKSPFRKRREEKLLLLSGRGHGFDSRNSPCFPFIISRRFPQNGSETEKKKWKKSKTELQTGLIARKQLGNLV
jgi:hypothetical protein